MNKELYHQLVKLGTTNPDLREDIRPILAAFEEDDDEEAEYLAQLEAEKQSAIEWITEFTQHLQRAGFSKPHFPGPSSLWGGNTKNLGSSDQWFYGDGPRNVNVAPWKVHTTIPKDWDGGMVRDGMVKVSVTYQDQDSRRKRSEVVGSLRFSVKRTPPRKAAQAVLQMID